MGNVMQRRYIRMMGGSLTLTPSGECVVCVSQFNRHVAAGAANWVIDELEKLGYIEVARWD